MKKAIVIKHIKTPKKTYEEFSAFLNKEGFDEITFFDIEDKLSLQEQEQISESWKWKKIIFLTPVPSMMSILNRLQKKFRVVILSDKTGWKLV